MVGNSATRVRYRAMERLWAPWRLQYVKSASSENDAGCVFCAKLGATTARRSCCTAASAASRC